MKLRIACACVLTSGACGGPGVRVLPEEPLPVDAPCAAAAPGARSRCGATLQVAADPADVRVLGGPRGSVASLEVDARHVYWVDRQASRVLRMPKHGGAPELVAWSQSNIASFALSPEGVSWLTTSCLPTVSDGVASVRSTSKRGGAWVELVSFPNCRGTGARFHGPFAADRASTFIVIRQVRDEIVDELVAVDHADGDTTTLAEDQREIRGLALDGETVYFAYKDGVRSVPRDGGSIRDVSRADYPDYHYVADVAVDERFVYWAEYRNQGPSALKRMPKAGGPVAVLADSIPEPHDIALDATTAFVSTRCVDARCTILRVPKAGGPAEQVVSFHPANALVMAVDERWLYWAPFEAGSIQRVATGSERTR